MKGLKKIIVFSLILLMVCTMTPMVPAMQAEAASSTVYCRYESGNTYKGSGTPSDPYRYLIDAVNAVEDNGTIIINGPEAYVNVEAKDESGQIPWIINKNVTIRGEQQSYLIEVRRGGIVLGGNVKFENVTMLLANKYHNGIYANGHTLTLNNVARSGSGNPVNIYGGSMYNNKTGDTGLAHKDNEPGQNAVINLNGAKTNVANIYAGSVDGKFDGDTTITVNGEKGMKVGDIYASGSNIGLYDQKDMFDMNPPDSPLPNAATRPVNGNVTINLTNAGVSSVVGTRTTVSGNKKTTVNFGTDYLNTNLFLYDVDELNVNRGGYEPVKSRAVDGKTLTAQAPAKEISIAKYTGSPATVLDLSKWGNSIDGIDKLSGAADATKDNAGVLVLPRKGALIAGTLEGDVRLATDTFFNGSSGFADYEHAYITAQGTGKVFFVPNDGQSDMTISYDSAGRVWKTSAATATSTGGVTDFEITNNVITATYENVNVLDNEDSKVKIPVRIKTADDKPTELSWVKLGYSVSYDGGAKKPMTVTSFLGNYTASSDELNMYMYQEGNSGSNNTKIWVRPVPDADEFNKTPWTAAKAGTYDIEITAPTTKGTVTRNVKLIVSGDEAASAKETSISLTKPSDVQYGANVSLVSKLTDSSGITPVDMSDAENSKISYYVNGTDITSRVSGGNIKVDSSNGFRTGANNISAAYPGSTDYKACVSNTVTFNVNPATVTIGGFSADSQTHSYDGDAKNVDLGSSLGVYAGGSKLADIDRDSIIVTYKDSKSKVVSEPVMPGTYTTLLSVPAGEGYKAVNNQDGPQIIINKIDIAGVNVDVTDTAAGALLTGTVSGAAAFSPFGTISLTVDGKSFMDIPVKNGSFEKALAGADVVTAGSYSDSADNLTYDFKAAANTPYNNKANGTVSGSGGSSGGGAGGGGAGGGGGGGGAGGGGDAATDDNSANGPQFGSVSNIIGRERVETSLKLADETKALLNVDKYNTVIVADASNFPDGLTASYLSATFKAPVLLTNRPKDSDVKAYISKNLSSEGNVIVVGGAGVIPQSFEQGMKCTRLAGSDRYATNLQILEYVMKTNKTGNLIVACGSEFADALSVSATGEPIMIVDSTLSREQEAFIKKYGINNITIVGGTGAVNTTVEASLRKLASTRRIGGKTRIETSKLVGNSYFPEAQTMIYTKADVFADALSGSLLANTLGAPIRLSYKTTDRDSCDKAYILGGLK